MVKTVVWFGQSGSERYASNLASSEISVINFRTYSEVVDVIKTTDFSFLIIDSYAGVDRRSGSPNILEDGAGYDEARVDILGEVLGVLRTSRANKDAQVILLHRRNDSLRTHPGLVDRVNLSIPLKEGLSPTDVSKIVKRYII